MRRTLVIASLALTTMLGGCAVTPYYGPPRIYPAQVYTPAPVYAPNVYHQNHGYQNYNNGYREQHRWNSWYRCQQVYGNRARCVY